MIKWKLLIVQNWFLIKFPLKVALGANAVRIPVSSFIPPNAEETNLKYDPIFLPLLRQCALLVWFPPSLFFLTAPNQNRIEAKLEHIEKIFHSRVLGRFFTSFPTPTRPTFLLSGCFHWDTVSPFVVRWLPLRSLLLLLVPRSVLAPVVAADGNCIKLKHACKRMKPCCHGWSRTSAGKWMNEAERIPEGDALSFSGRCGSSTRHGDGWTGTTNWLATAGGNVGGGGVAKDEMVSKWF